MKKQLLVLLILFSVNSFSQKLDNVLVVEGKGVLSIKPEIARFLINFELIDTIYEKCIINSLLTISKTKAFLTKNGIEENELKTVSYSIEKNFKYDPLTHESVFQGYKTSIPLVIEISINESKIDKIFEIISNNFKTNYSISFELSDSQINNARDEIIKLAILDAKKKAKTICDENNIKISNIVRIQYGEPAVLSNFIGLGYELLEKGDSKIMIRGSRSIKNVLTPTSVDLKTNIIIGWAIEY